MVTPNGGYRRWREARCVCRGEETGGGRGGAEEGWGGWGNEGGRQAG
jgi:hypothetical protein